MNGVGDMIAVARKANGLTQGELADLAGVKQPTINRYEAGDRIPDDEVLERLAVALGVTTRFLELGGRESAAIAVDAHMRRQKTTRASLWRTGEARLNLMRAHSSQVFEQVSLAAQAMVPTFDVLDGTSPEDAARLVRAQWKMPIGPVRNLVGWLEAAGCLVFEEDFGTHRIDGMSQWIGDHPVMLLNSEVPADRQRLTKAHELGHLVLHSNEPSDSMEEEANSFAAEFLMPEAVIRSSLRDVSLGHLQELKREWGVSMQALFERSYRLGFVSSVDRTRFYKAMNARGWKANEPGGEYVPRETPRLALHIGDELLARGYSREEIANIAGYRSTQGCPFVPHGGGLRVVQ